VRAVVVKPNAIVGSRRRAQDCPPYRDLFRLPLRNGVDETEIRAFQFYIFALKNNCIFPLTGKLNFAILTPTFEADGT
jgi:hypothetical protein